MYVKSRHLCLRIVALSMTMGIINICIFPLCMAMYPIERPLHNKIVQVKQQRIRVNSFSEEQEVIPTEIPTIVPTLTPTETPTKLVPPPPEEVNDMYPYSEKDIALLERVTMSEAGNQPFEAKVAVTQTILNRLHSGKYGKSLYKIVHSKNQFSTADNGDPNKSVIEAVEYAIINEPYPEDMFYFREDHYHKWADNYKHIGAFYFSTYPD